VLTDVQEDSFLDEKWLSKGCIYLQLWLRSGSRCR